MFNIIGEKVITYIITAGHTFIENEKLNNLNILVLKDLNIQNNKWELIGKLLYCIENDKVDTAIIEIVEIVNQSNPSQNYIYTHGYTFCDKNGTTTSIPEQETEILIDNVITTR